MKRLRAKTLIFAFLAGMVTLHVVLALNSLELVRKGYPDFTIFYSAGKIVRSGLGRQLYDPATQWRVQQEFASKVIIREGPLPYNHPPFESLIFVPFTFLPYFPAYLLWDCTSLLILVALPFLLRPHVPVLRQISPAFCVFACLGYFPVFVTFLQGQDMLVLLLLFTLAFVSFRKGAEFSAGAWLGLGLFRFHLILPIILVLILRKVYKAVLGFAAVSVALVLISAAIVGWNGVLSYPRSVLKVEDSMALRKTIVPFAMPNLHGLLQKPVTAVFSTRASAAIIATLSIALLLFTVARWKTNSRPNFDLGFSLVVIAALLVGYHAFSYDLTLLLLPIALVIDYIRAEPQNRASRAALLGPVFLLFLSPVHMLFWFRADLYNLMALVLLFWYWAIAREANRSPVRAPEVIELPPAPVG